MLDRSGYLQDLRDERSEDAEGRVENLARARLGRAANTRAAKPEPSLGGFVDRLSLLSDADEEQGTRDARDLDDDAAQRQGPGVPDRRSGRARRRAVPALALARRRGRARGGAAAVLRRHDAGARDARC